MSLRPGADPHAGAALEPMLIFHLALAKIMSRCELSGAPVWAKPILRAAIDFRRRSGTGLAHNKIMNQVERSWLVVDTASGHLRRRPCIAPRRTKRLSILSSYRPIVPAQHGQTSRGAALTDFAGMGSTLINREIDSAIFWPDLALTTSGRPLVLRRSPKAWELRRRSRTYGIPT